MKGVDFYVLRYFHEKIHDRISRIWRKKYLRLCVYV